MRPQAIEAWHALVEARDPHGLDALLDESVVFESPVVHTPQVGKAITTKYLASALVVLNNEHFHYVGEWFGPSSGVLEFATIVNGIKVNGVDIIAWNAQNRITHFKVMVRPLKAVNMLHQMMAAQLAAPVG
ncbi:MAG TPA: nuclear transport factor 2 family protein [Rhodoblastus sp.]|nr:nuclear transport factor 2 family protein [Rhodoblastus sp.]